MTLKLLDMYKVNVRHIYHKTKYFSLLLLTIYPFWIISEISPFQYGTMVGTLKF